MAVVDSLLKSVSTLPIGILFKIDYNIVNIKSTTIYNYTLIPGRYKVFYAK